MEIVTLIAILGLIGFIVWDKTHVTINPDIVLRQKNEEEAHQIRINEAQRQINELKVSLEKEKTQKDELSGKGKEMYVSLTSFKEKNNLLQTKLDDALKKITTYENTEFVREKDFLKRIDDLENSRKSLENEQNRVTKEEELRLAQKEAQRDRMWNEHENKALSIMREVCQKPELSFSFFENTTLPDTFDGTLKPDFLIEFLSQYVIFDAKMSRSANLQTYLNEQVKKTVKKIKSSKNVDEIYQTVFFIIPTIEIVTLKKLHFFEDGYNFYIIPVECFESILAAYKKVSNYELADQFDPMERENIVNLIASYDHHISRQNAINLLTSIEGLKVMHQKGSLNPSLLADVDNIKKKIRLENLKPSDLKKFIQDPTEQVKSITELIEPIKPSISKEEMNIAQLEFKE